VVNFWSSKIKVMIQTFKYWLSVIISWVFVGAAWFVHFVSTYSTFLAGLASIVAILFTLWQWRRAATKQHKVKHHHEKNTY